MTLIGKAKNKIKELELEIQGIKDWIKDMENPQFCQHCGKQIDKDYLPSYSCEKCVEEHIANRKTGETRIKYFEGK
jgi:predicted RNA-binding Zn-ribbon protein involved in translation (DUF1610 family)